MDNKRQTPPCDDLIWAEARALEASIRAIRKAQGKKNPQDFPTDSWECTVIMEEFVRDVSRVLDMALRASDDDEAHGVGAAG